MQMEQRMQILSLKIEAITEIAVYKKHGLHAKTQNPNCLMSPAGMNLHVPRCLPLHFPTT